MAPFKQYMIVAYRALPYKGLVHIDMKYPHEFTVVISSWWGRRMRTKKYVINISWKLHVHTWFDHKKNRWLDRLPWH